MSNGRSDRGLPVAVDDHWKSLDERCDAHCHEWQHGPHIDSLPVEANAPYNAVTSLPANLNAKHYDDE